MSDCGAAIGAEWLITIMLALGERRTKRALTRRRCSVSASPRLPSDGLAVLDQAATKSDVGAVDPNGDIVTGVAGAEVKIP